MSNQIVEEVPTQAPAAGGGAQEKLEKQARQLAYDVKYKVKQQMNRGTKLDPAAVKKAYISFLGRATGSPQVKALAKKKLLGEATANQIVAVLREDGDKTFKVRVTDKQTGNTYVRIATRAKIAELRANTNIASVEMTGYGEPTRSSAQATGSKPTAKKDFDGDGKKETSSKEHAGVVHNAIQKKKGGKQDGQDTRSEAFIADAVGPHSDGHVALMEPEEEITDKPIDVMKGKNTKIIKINPKVSEDKEYKKDDDKKGDEAKDPLDTVGCNDPDPRSMKAKVQLMKNKFRERVLNMSHELEGEALVEDFIIESISMASDYFLSEGINEDGLEKIVEEVGLDDFTQFVLDLPQSDFLTEERSATRAKKRDYEKVKAAVYAKDAKNKEEGKREYSTTKLAKQKYGDEEAPEGKPEVKKTPAAKVVTATKTAKKTQNKSTSSPKGIIGKVGSFISKGIERHNKARQAGKVPEKRVKEFASGVKSGVQTAVNVAKVAYKATQPQVRLHRKQLLEHRRLLIKIRTVR